MISERSLAKALRTDRATSRRMARTRGRDNPLEKALRSALFRSGMRYRIHYPVPGTPRRTIDIAFPARKLAVFIDGCFWHGCPEHGTWPTRNSAFWKAKINANRERDHQTDASLRASGWRVLRFWEHERDNRCVRQILRVFRKRC
jgi:DNA mismatch endonuclease, patch repair protein